MKETVFGAVRISEHVWWVGAADWNVRNFHGYLTDRGSSYNAFLIVDEKVTLIDAVKAPFTKEMLDRVASVIDPEKIDYIVSNHSEPDHSGGLPEVIAEVKPEKVFASVIGAKTLAAYYGDLNVTPVKTGDLISIGSGNLAFVDTKMLHWPDSMVSFYDRDGVLFAQDAFGQHLAGSKLWADEYDQSVIEYEMNKYYANIINAQSGKVLSLLDALPALNLPLQILAPDHGPLFRKDFDKVFAAYRRYAEQKPQLRAVVVFSTMWHATEALARAFADGVRSAGVEVEIIDLAVSERSAVMTAVAKSGLAAFGAPTMNNQVFPAMADVLTYVKGLKPQNKIGFAFGSCGWSGEGAKQITAELEAMKFDLPIPFIQSKYNPTDEELKKAFEAGETLAEKLKTVV
ncbi:MAG: flavodoxin domain-containing protein, partial [Lentisphaeria bacterium]|nr:flavodoxin domain-containing protein [Lentisphaeria bacterium]